MSSLNYALWQEPSSELVVRAAPKSLNRVRAATRFASYFLLNGDFR